MILENSKCLREIALAKIAEEGKPIFIALSGSHAYGTSNSGSDFDIRGVYVMQTDRLFHLQRPMNHVKYTDITSGVDLVADEIGKYIGLVAKSDVHRSGWINSPIFFESVDFEELKDVVRRYGLSKTLGRNFLRFGRSLLAQRNGVDLKKDLYIVGAYLSGLYAMREGEENPNLVELNNYFGIPLVDLLIKEKQSGASGTGLSCLDSDILGLIDGLDTGLVRSINASRLPENPNRKKLEDFLVKLRRGNL